MNHNLVIDADSLVMISAHREPIDLELAYLQFCGEINNITSAVFSEFGYTKPNKKLNMKGSTLIYEIVLTKGKNFRHILSKKYKAKRTEKPEQYKKLQQLIIDRLPNVVIPVNAEADDYVISKANIEHCFVSAIDKDVCNASPTPCYNYNKKEWKPGNKPNAVEEWYYYQALMGDSGDGISGAKGIGKTKAIPIARQSDNWEYYASYFESEADAILSNRLVRMNQWDHRSQQVTLWTPPNKEEI